MAYKAKRNEHSGPKQGRGAFYGPKVDGELWHGTWEGDESDLRRVDRRTGEVLERIEMLPGVAVSGLESDGGELFFCGGGSSGKVRAVRRPKRGSAPGSSSEIPVDSTRKRTSATKKT
jgi:hypothetical protein